MCSLADDPWEMDNLAQREVYHVRAEYMMKKIRERIALTNGIERESGDTQTPDVRSGSYVWLPTLLTRFIACILSGTSSLSYIALI